jgi:hypothetical protein
LQETDILDATCRDRKAASIDFFPEINVLHFILEMLNRFLLLHTRLDLWRS